VGGIGVTAIVVVAFDRDDERGEVAVADDASKLPFGFDHAGGGPAQRHLAGRPALHVALGARTISIIDSAEPLLDRGPVAFSVEPSQSPSGIFTRSLVILS
jgi:hypothetical protein